MSAPCAGTGAAIVTGAARGIGAAVAARLSADGRPVALVDLDAEKLDATVARLRAVAADPDAPRVLAVRADIGASGAADAILAEVVGRLGPVDVLVNNAAQHGRRHDVRELTPEEWAAIVAVNLTGALFLARAVAGPMVERGRGSIVNIGAIQATLPVWSYAAYATTKGGVAAMTRALAAELSPHGVRVNAVLPGAVDTASFRSTLSGAADPGPVPTLLRRRGRPEEIAAAVSFLAGDEASFVTGASLVVDGGRSLSRAADPFESLRPTRTEP